MDLRAHQLPPDTVLASDDAIMSDSPTRGTRRFTPADFAAEVLRASGDSVYMRAEAVEDIVAAQDVRITAAEQNAEQAAVDAGLASTRSQEAEDTADAAAALAQAASAAANGFQVEDYLGEIDNLADDPGAVIANAGKWWTVTVDGTLTHALVTGMVVRPGDRLLSNGSSWQRWLQAPTYITPGAVSRSMLEQHLRNITTPLQDDTWAYAIIDSQQRQAFGIRHDGSLVGRFELPDDSITTAKIEDGGVTRLKLDADVSASIMQAMLSAENAFCIVDDAGRVAFSVKKDGSVDGKITIPNGSVTTVKLADGAVTEAKLEAAITSILPIETPESMEFKFAIVDEDDKVAFGIRSDGTIYGRFAFTDDTVNGRSLIAGSVPASSLDAAASRAAVAGSKTWVEDDCHAFRRGHAIDLSTATDGTNGASFTAFPPMRTPVLYGVNDTGAALLFRRSPRLILRGTNDRGTWAAGAVAPAASADAGDWWTATGSGTFDTVAYTAGERIQCVGNYQQGGTVTPMFLKGRAGEFFLKGEFTPSGFSPVGPADGDAWVASASGTFDGFAYAIGDVAFRVGSAWLPAPCSASAVANGAAFQFAVVNASEVEVRRSDKSTTSVTVNATGYRTPNQKAPSDNVLLRGDSMVSTGGLDVALAALITPRTMVPLSYSGASSERVIATARKEAGRSDAYRGWVHIWYMGQNDSGDLKRTKRGALEAASLSGARDGRFAFITMPGQLTFSWNGTRLVGNQHEARFGGTGNLFDFEAWCAKVFPGGTIASAARLLESAGSLQHLQFPGESEADVATIYGVLPFSYFFNLATVPWTPDDLTFTGYHSAAGLPSGGADGDYQLRTANGTIGRPLVRWGGAWAEVAFDATHMSPAGNAALASAISAFLTSNTL